MSTVLTPHEPLSNAARALLDVSDLDRCDNCHNDLYTVIDDHILCGACSNIARAGSQIWTCRRCGTLRVYGVSFTVEDSAKRLNCVRCHDVTPHSFLRISRGREHLHGK